MSTSKCLIVIAGTVDDVFFHHACFIAMNLAKLLPNFFFEKICKDITEWKDWVNAICKLRGWEHTKSPLIWKQYGVTGTKVTYIGGSNKFREFVLEYYNIHSEITRENLEALKVDLLLVHEIEKKISLKQQDEYRRITIIGAAKSLCLELVLRLITMKELRLSRGIFINLYDKSEHFSQLEEILKNINVDLNAAVIIQDISSGLCNCDILICLDEIIREKYELYDSWYQKNYEYTKTLVQQINDYAPSHMKIIFCSMGPTCLSATIMQNLVTKLPKTNIVVVSAHYGLELANNFVKSLGFNPQDFGCPPVWGFLGISNFVDICHMVQKYDVYRPNSRALKAKENTTLSVGIKQPELRWFFYIAHDKSPYKDHLQHKPNNQVNRLDDLQKCKAICDLLNLWYSKDIGDEIITLGICSNGSFGIPDGIVFSQPACLQVSSDNTRVWMPCTDFPAPNMSVTVFENLILTAVTIVQKLLTKNHK